MVIPSRLLQNWCKMWRPCKGHNVTLTLTFDRKNTCFSLIIFHLRMKYVVFIMSINKRPYSPEHNECLKNLTSELNQKQQHFFSHASRSLTCILFVAVAFCLMKKFLEEWDLPWPIFGPFLDLPLDRSGRKTTTLVRDHENSITTKFHQNPSSGSGEEVENVKSLRTDWQTARYDNIFFLV